MNNRIFRLALSAAKKSTSPFKLGAIVYRGSRVYGIGTNDMYKTHPKAPTMEYKPHAEFRAMIRAGEDNLRGSRLAVVRIGRNGEIGNAKPCPYCYEQAKAAGIRDIEWSE